ncbi:hypothetical protein HOY80DRAFT_963620 [Tuber brumale]|nr:hypothetical protein HOY80DRAFT_963620 [Tuber brumale]
MPGRQTNSWGDPIHFSQSLTAGREHPGPSPHAEMSWTVCYDDDCEIHLCEKEGSGWFPKRKSGKGPRNGNGKGKGKGKGARRDLDEDDPENRPWGDGGDGGGCPIPTEEEVKVILARKAAREAAQAKAAAATVASGVKKGVRIGREEEAKPKAGVGGGVKPKATPEVKSDWAERIRELLAGGVKAGGGARLNTPKCVNDSSGGFPAEAIAKSVASAGNPAPAVAKYEPRSGNGQFASPNRSAIAPASLNPSFEKKLLTSPPLTTARTPQKTHFTSPHTTATGAPTEHNLASEKKRSTSPPVTTTHAPAIPNSHLEKKQRFASSTTTNPHQKQPLQPRKDQGKTSLHTKPPKMPHPNPPVAVSIPAAVITARVAVKAKLAAEREEKLPQMVKYKRAMGVKAGVV